MRILAVSDSHGRNDYVRQAVEQTEHTMGKIDAMLHMGDVEADVDELRSMIKGDLYIVGGNCDYNPELSSYLRFTLGGYNILITHGNRLSVSYDLLQLQLFAEQNGADLVMYGHTHQPYLQEVDGLTIINPGSIAYPRQAGRMKTYLVMEIANDGSITYLWQILGDTSEQEEIRKKIFGMEY